MNSLEEHTDWLALHAIGELSVNEQSTNQIRFGVKYFQFRNRIRASHESSRQMSSVSVAVEREDVNKASLQERRASRVSLSDSTGCRIVATVECLGHVGTRVKAGETDHDYGNN